MPAEDRTAFLYDVQHTFVKQRRRSTREELTIRHRGRGDPTKILLPVCRRKGYGAVIDASLNAPISPFREAVKASRRRVAARLRRQSNSDERRWPFMLNTERHYLDMDVIELVLSPV